MATDNLDENRITVSKAELFKAITDNRATHATEHEEAVVGYREAMTRELERVLAVAKSGDRISIQGLRDLPVPEEHLGDYDRVIRMLHMSQADTIVISEAQFAQYVLDDWQWKGRFSQVASSYKASGR